MTDGTTPAEAAGRDEAVLTCRGLTKEFRDGSRTVRALDGVDLDVRRGQVVVVAGRSGAGKSTLLGLLAGLERPTSGTICFDGRPLEGLSGQELALLRRRSVGIIFQSLNLLPAWTAMENVEAALLPAGLGRAERRSRARSLLEGLGLGDRLGNLPSQLSVGEQQRVAVARTMANRPMLILADEPTGDVDEETGRQIIEVLLQPVRQGAAMVVATHGAFPADLADRTLRLRDGRPA